VELGILSLGDLQRDQRTGRPHRPADRMAEVLGYAVLADQLGLDVFALGEHHSAEFFTSSPAVVLAAAAASTSRIRLTSATTLLGVADPVRVYEDFASLDLISRGRAEVIAGRSAFVEPFALFGYDTADYDALFAEKLGLLLDIRARENVTWTGRFRPPPHAAAVVPRALQQPLPVWVGVGGSSDSAERAGLWGAITRVRSCCAGFSRDRQAALWYSLISPLTVVRRLIRAVMSLASPGSCTGG
jgi:alkanesulfonate monooxygenase SsuD/methylene tetrahydromethanopterin reductase-like flavin-dependent oxidoreductase (luciferase family)